MEKFKKFKLGDYYNFIQEYHKERASKYPREHSNEKKPICVSFPSYSDVIKECACDVSIQTETREFQDGMGESIKKIKIEIDLSNSRWPWQPHGDQTDDLAYAVSEMILEEYYNYASNLD